jgi:hypothetical protein
MRIIVESEENNKITTDGQENNQSNGEGNSSQFNIRPRQCDHDVGEKNIVLLATSVLLSAFQIYLLASEKHEYVWFYD